MEIHTYTWDSENRLLSVAPTSPAVGDKSLAYIYDAHHRRTIRSIHEWNGSAWSHVESIRFIYDGWNVIGEYSLTSTTETLTRELTWGTDLSGSLQGAGGVGGLLMVEEISTTTTAYHYQYDGNGNVTEITDASGNPAASYRYDAFGNTLVATGSYAATNRYRFSTKPLDNEIANAPLYYYGYRYYGPRDGRWPSRDPIGEEGGINLYGFVGNQPISAVDVLGLFDDALPATLAPLAPLTYNPVGATIVGGAVIVTGSIWAGNQLAEGLIDEPSDIPADQATVDRINQRTKLKRQSCQRMYILYKSQEAKCRKCRDCQPCLEVAANISCWARVALGRQRYLDAKCDYFLEGSIKAGSAIKELAHEGELRKVIGNVGRCIKALSTCEL